MAKLEREIKRYFKPYIKQDQDFLQKYDSSILTVSYLVGEDPKNCAFNSDETEQTNEWNTIEDIIIKLQNENA